MLRKSLLGLFAAATLSFSAFAADVIVKVAPPRAVVESRPVSPGVGYVWTPGYQRWDGRAYAWAPGAWVRPPRAHAHWVAPHWVHRGGGYVMVQGYWR